MGEREEPEAEEPDESKAGLLCLDENRLAAYVDGVLGPDELAQINRHLSDCPHCRAEVSDFVRCGIDEGPALVGASEGRYLIESLIGRGAMGTVYLARDADLDRRVALKFLHSTSYAGGNAVKEAAEKLLRKEATLLARLSDPHVVHVHEIGSSPGGTFVAMEYVEGATLLDWVAAGERDWRDIVDVLLQAASGLSSAHKAGVIHRDFKPSNMLVGNDGRVRIVDFGLARVDEAASLFESVDGNGAPLQSSFAGTPAYMAPEVKAGKRADAASDQYSFCATAYEALCGVRPDEEQVTRQRELPKALLEVLQRGLRADPDRRYASMAELVARLREVRFSSRRMLWGVAALVVVFVGIFLGTRSLVVSRQVDPCTGGKSRVARVWNGERRDALMNHFANSPLAVNLSKSFDDFAESWQASYREVCLDTRVRLVQSTEALDRRMSCLRRKLATAETLVSSVEGLDDTGELSAGVVTALPPLSECDDVDALLAVVQAPDDPSASRRIDELFELLAGAEAWIETKQFGPAETRIDELANEVETIGYAPLSAQLAWLQGRLLLSRQAFDDARTLFRAGLASAEAGRDAAIKFELVLSLAEVDERVKLFASAKEWHALAEAILGSTSEDGALLRTSRLLQRRGGVAYGEGKLAEARDFWLEALEARKRGGAPELAQTGLLGNLGIAEKYLGNAKAALDYSQRAFDIQRRHFGDDHPMLAASYLRLAGTLRLSGNTDDMETALEYYQRAYDISVASFGEKSNDAALALTSLGMIKLQLLRLDVAERDLQAALAIFMDPETADPLAAATTYANLGQVASMRDDYPLAIERYTKGLELRRATLGAEHIDLADSYYGIGYAHLNNKNYPEAVVSLEKSKELIEKTGGPDYPSVAHPLTALGRAYTLMGEPKKAIPLLERALRLREGATGGAIESTKLRLSQALHAAGRDPERVRALAGEALEGSKVSGNNDVAMQLEIKAWVDTLASAK